MVYIKIKHQKSDAPSVIVGPYDDRSTAVLDLFKNKWVEVTPHNGSHWQKQHRKGWRMETTFLSSAKLEDL